MKYYSSLFGLLVFLTQTFWAQTPTANDDVTSAVRNGAVVEIAVLSNDDFGNDGPNTDHALTFTNGSKNNASANGASIKVDDNGTPTIYDDDFIAYTPTQSFEGVDTFTYVITDADGDADSAQVTVNVSSSGETFTSYIENFDESGQPNGPTQDTYWKFFNDIHPSQTDWNSFIPGDGYAYITVDADSNNDTDASFPYQTLVFGKIDENHRIEVRMKGPVLDGGLVGFLFTYQEEDEKFNEVDIELVAQDANADIPNHDISPPNGWTDARFNTWRNASIYSFLPISSTFKPVKNANDENISLMDDEFHTLTIDWREDQVDYFIDGVLQESFDTNIAMGMSEVIIGFRQLTWAGDFNWTGNHNLVIDYFKIEALDALSTQENQLSKTIDISIFPNPAFDEIKIVSQEFHEIKSMEITNLLGSKMMTIKGYQNRIDVSSLSKGMYVITTRFSDGSSLSKKIIKQ